MRALGHAVRHGRWRRSSRGTVPDLPGIRPDAARCIIDEFLGRDRDGGWLSAEAGRDLLVAAPAGAGLQAQADRTLAEAAAAAREA